MGWRRRIARNRLEKRRLPLATCYGILYVWTVVGGLAVARAKEREQLLQAIRKTIADAVAFIGDVECEDGAPVHRMHMHMQSMSMSMLMSMRCLCSSVCCIETKWRGCCRVSTLLKKKREKKERWYECSKRRGGRSSNGTWWWWKWWWTGPVSDKPVASSIRCSLSLIHI